MTPAEVTLQKAAKHVAHDIRMLAAAYKNRSDSFAYIVWFVSCRSVMEFFRSGSGNEDDILAKHFLEPDEWDVVLKMATEPSDYASFRTAVNKLAAHLTYSRIEYEGDDRYAPSAEITDYLLGLAGVFYTRLPEKRKLWFGGLGR